MRPKRSPAPTGPHPPNLADLPDVEGSNAAKTFAGSDAKPAKTFPGSTPRPRFTAAVYRKAITEKLDAGLSLQRIWQDLVEEYGYGASYESVKRFVRTIAPTRRAVGRLSLRARRGSASGFLPRCADARGGHGRVATAVGVSHDARSLAARLRRGGVGSEARDIPAAP